MSSEVPARGIGFYVVHWIVSALLGALVVAVMMRGYGNDAIDRATLAERHAARSEEALAQARTRLEEQAERSERLREIDSALLDDLTILQEHGESIDLAGHLYYVASRLAEGSIDDDELAQQLSQAMRQAIQEYDDAEP